MILKSIKVAGWRCFANPLEIGPFEEGINIVHAPNATGKSTLFDAMVRALVDGHRIGGRDVEAIRPWGRNLAPTVSVEFTSGGTEYRITKRFLDRPFSRLERQEKGEYVPLAEGDAADERVRAIAMGSAPGRGLSKPEHWGPAQVLWAPQGELKLEKLSGNLLADIRTALGAQICGPASRLVEEKIDIMFGEVYTPTGKLKSGDKGAPVVRLQAALAEATRKRDDAVGLQVDFDAAARRVQELGTQRAEAAKELARVKKDMDEARVRAEEYRKLISDRDQRAERARAAGAEHSELRARIDSIRSVRNEIKNATESLEKLVADIAAVDQESAQREKEAAAARAALEELRGQRAAVDNAAALVNRARRFVACAGELSALADRLARVEAAKKTEEMLLKQRHDLSAPSESTLKAIRQAAEDLFKAKTSMESALLNLEILPETAGYLDIIKGEGAGVVSIEPGEPIHIKGTPEILVHLPGAGRIRAWGQAGNVEEWRRRKAEAEEELTRLTWAFGTTDVERLSELTQQGADLERKIGEAKKEAEVYLQGRTLEFLQQEKSRLETQLAELGSGHPEWSADPPDVTALESAAKEASDAFKVGIDAAESRRDRAVEAAAVSSKNKAVLEARREGEAKRLLKAEEEMSKLTVDGRSNVEREEELRKLALAWDGARASLEEAKKALEAYKDDPVATVQKLEKDHDRASSLERKLELDERDVLRDLRALTERGPYSLLAAAEEEVEKLRGEVAMEELRTGAIKLLHDVVGECKQEVLAGVVGPVEERATGLLRRIAGDRLGNLKMGMGFVPEGVVPGECDAPVMLEHMSGGEEEQVYLAVRLALAEVLAREERQLLVLDDALTYTDSYRLSRVLKILEEVSQHLQILILTCDRGRYLDLSNANLVPLEH